MSKASTLTYLLLKNHQVLQYGQSEYVRQFGMAVSNELVGLDGRIIKPPTLKYNTEFGQSSVVCAVPFPS